MTKYFGLLVFVCIASISCGNTQVRKNFPTVISNLGCGNYRQVSYQGIPNASKMSEPVSILNYDDKYYVWYFDLGQVMTSIWTSNILPFKYNLNFDFEFYKITQSLMEAAFSKAEDVIIPIPTLEASK